MGTSDASLDRYVRQMRYAPLGEAGQRRLIASRVLVCGCGALGSVLAETLARSGVGHLRLADRDFLEINNLQRQVLYDEADVAAEMPKAIAAAARLRAVNSQVEIEPIVADVEPGNIEKLVEDVDLIVDGTDNFETRFLLNDVALKHNIPWIYGGCIGSEGQTMNILPGRGPCLRCVIPEPPAAGTMPTCDTAGIIGPIVNVVASIQTAEALKILAGQLDAVRTSLLVIELWENQFRQIGTASLAASSRCPACRDREFAWLEGGRASSSAVLCGRNAVQLRPAAALPISLEQLEQKLSGIGRVSRNAFLMRLAVDDYLLTIFPDGRAIVGGTDDVATARSVYARYIGA